MIAAPGSRVALEAASEAVHLALRRHFGLLPGGLATGRADLGYAGAEFRVYAYMRIGFAARFYATLHERWDAAALAAALDVAGLDERFDVGRMKRAYQRALVLAFALAASPRLLVVERAEEFDEPGAGALLEYALRTAPTVVGTYSGTLTPSERVQYDAVVPAAELELDQASALP